jgi:beta-xylosidase
VHLALVRQVPIASWSFVCRHPHNAHARACAARPCSSCQAWRGRPVVQLVGGAWDTPYPSPVLPPPPRQVTPLTGVGTFDGTTVKPKWEWNHNSDNGKWSVNNGLTLRTATVANDLYWARNTLTDRIQGPTSTATIQLDYATMRDGDRAGLALLRDLSAWIGIERDGGTTR